MKRRILAATLLILALYVPHPTTWGQPAAHSGWWCDEHGIPEDVCSMCSTKVAAEFKKKGDWCDKHDRALSQCFICKPERREFYAAQYRAKHGKEPPPFELEEKRAEDPTRALLREKVATLKLIHELTVQAHSRGATPSHKIHETKVALLNAQLELCETNEERLKLHQEIVKEAETCEKQIAKEVAGGQVPASEALRAKVVRLDAQIALEKAKNAK